MKVICAFSSDSRPLYIADIYRVLALPEDYIVRFRYKKKYVGDAILNDPQSVVGADVAVFFSGHFGAAAQGTIHGLFAGHPCRSV